MRQHGVVGSAAGLVPFSHLGWSYRDQAQFLDGAAQYITDGLQQNQRIAYVRQGSHDELHAELANIPGIGEQLESDRIEVMPTADFYVHRRGTDIVDVDSMVAKYVSATNEAIANGYTGLRVVVDVTPEARTPEQRDPLSALEHLIDQKMTSLPLSVLCAYDTTQLRDNAAELICLHPFVSKGAVRFRLYSEPNADTGFTLAGEIDAASHELFATTLQRIWPLTSGHVRCVDAQDLEFIGHQQLWMLDEFALQDNSKVMLCTNQRIPARLVELLSLTNVSVAPTIEPADETEQLRNQLQQRDRQLESRPVIEQVKGMLTQTFGLDSQQAFAVLAMISQDANTKLRDIANRIHDALTANAPDETRQATLDMLRTVQQRLLGQDRPPQHPPVDPIEHN